MACFRRPPSNHAMRVFYRNSAPRPSTANAYMSSAIMHTTTTDKDGNPKTEVVSVGLSPSARTALPPLRGHGITALEMDLVPSADTLYIVDLFSLLCEMPHLQDLTIDIYPGAVMPAPSPADLLAIPVPFSLRRLVLSEIFPGWMRLLSRSRDTLECLSLGSRPWGDPDEFMTRGRPDYVPRYADTCEGVSLSAFPRLRALRMEDTPEPRLLSAGARITSLTIRGDAPYLSIAQLALRAPLTRLTVVLIDFTDDESRALARALVEFPVFRALRTLAVESYADLQLAGHPGRMVLADTCRARRIALSVARVRPYCEWEKLEIDPRRGSR